MSFNFFDSIDKAKTSQRGEYFKKGRHKVRIDKVAFQESQKSPNPNFIIETTLVETDNPEMKVGATYSQIIAMGKQMSMQNVLQFLQGCFGIEGASPQAEICAAVKEIFGKDLTIREIPNWVCGDEQPLSQLGEIDLYCFDTITKTVTVEYPKGRPFTVCQWGG